MQNLQFTQTFELNNSPNDIKYIDTTDYVGQGILNSQVKGIFELKSVVGIFHQGDVTYASPDINRGATDTFVHNAPLDANGVVLNGLYTFKYTVKITAEQFSFPLVGLDQTGKRFIIAGNYVQQILNAIGGTINITGYGLNAGTYTVNVSTVSYDSINNITYVGVTGAILDPLYTPYTMVWTADQTYSVTNTVDYCFLEPSVNLEVISDCFQSSLKASDLTNYSATYCGTVLQPLSILGTMLIEYPKDPITGIPMHVDEVISINTANVSHTINPICTGDFQVTLDVIVNYMLPDGTVFTVQLTGYKAHSVACEEGLCCASQCIENVKTSYDLAKGINKVEADKLEKLLINIMAEWMLYSIFINCGDVSKAQTHLANIINYVQAANCNCCPKTSTSPVWIASPVSGGAGVTTVVTTCGNGITVTPSGTNPITYQVCLDSQIINASILAVVNSQALFDHTDTNKILPLLNNQVVKYNSVTGMWENVLLGLEHLYNVNAASIPGSNGYVLTWNTSTGLAEFVENNPVIVLHNDIVNVGTDANPLEKTLKTYSLLANKLSTNGDYVHIEALATITPSKGIKILKFYWGATPSLIESITTYNASTIKFDIFISRISSLSQQVEVITHIGSSPSTSWGDTRYLTAETLSNPLTIKFTGQDILFPAPAANSIIMNYLRITFYKK